MGTQRVLFCAESVYQLFNAVTLRMTEQHENECDLMLGNATDWNGEMICRLKASNVFGNVYMPDTHTAEYRFWDMTPEEKQEAVDHPDLFFTDGAPVDELYGILFLPIDHMYWKMLYRYEVVHGLVPRIMMYDEGVRAYTMPLPMTDNKYYLSSDEYQKAPFASAIDAYYLYQPELYAVKDYAYELKSIPNPAENPDVRNKLIEIYGYEPMPEEKYIYLEDFFFADAYVTNDWELFEQLGALVGKDSIIVKRHPRDKFDRFTPMGYKTVGQSVVPWEIQLLSNDLQGKVLLSVSSTSILTPYIIFNSNMHVISLEKMFIGENPTHKDAAFSTFFSRLKDWVNEKEVRFHTPSSMDELIETLRYISMMNTLDAQEEGVGDE